MDKLKFYVPEEHTEMLKDIKKVPFAKTDDGYRFAYWVYDLNDTEEKRAKLLESEHGREASDLLEDAKKTLKAIAVTEDDYLAWAIHRKEAGGIKEYHKAVWGLSVGLLMLAIDKTAADVVKETHKDAGMFYMTGGNKEANSGRVVLNRNNPFADVTIKSQQFFYKTETGDTETLFFNTNNIVEKTDKNGQDMLTMRPGFTVTKELGVVQHPVQEVTFSNSMTEPIVDNDDHVYVHID